MSYIDTMVAPVPTANKEAYIAHIRTVSAVFKEHGALRYVESWGDDVPEGKITDFRRAVQATPEEFVVVGFVTWADKASRDAGWEKIMKDTRMSGANMPFDGKRLIYGGFETIFEV